MVAKPDHVDDKSLKRLYNEDSCARAILDYLASRKYNSYATTVDRIETVLSRDGTNYSRRDVVGALKELEKLNCGRFVIGRRGQTSRFEWTVQMVEVGRVAKGEKSTVEMLRIEEAKPEEAEEAELRRNMIRHTFNLRQDCTVAFDLPSDFSEKEALRLGDFVKTLPFDIDKGA